MTKGVAVTGMGIISAIGADVPGNLAALREGRSGIGPITRLPTHLAGTVQVGGIALSDEDLADLLGHPSEGPHTRTSLLGSVAAEEALRQAGLMSVDRQNLGLITATTVGGMDVTEKYFYEYLTSDEHLASIDTLHAGHTGQMIADHLGIANGFVTTISTACSSASNAIMLGARMIKACMLDRVLVGGVDCLSKFTLNGFNTLMILSASRNRPFSEDRDGLNLGEAAAYLVLESDASVKARNATPIAYVAGFSNANDAHHQTASSENGDGATAAMLGALRTAGLSPSDIDHINAHGTATPNNDLSEGRAFKRVFGERVPPFTSTKPYTGHTLAAAGAVEAVFSILAMQQQVVFPTLNFTGGMSEFDLRPITKLTDMPLTSVLSNSLGFGGNCSSLILVKA
ncbi:MAG: beta-ketoacyl-[acyl-carrier-protein] synthase family protein [Flavobacteriales bacterium]|nr:beta-ketoacyl-[acyl-carrier-protein] synthase family protein [Flavobacteriales bacterium]